MSLPTKVYSDLLENLYAATLDEAQWQVFLAGLCEATGSVIAFLVRNDDAMGSRMLASGGFPAPEGVEDYDTSNPIRDAFMRMPSIGVVEVEDFLPHGQLAASDYYKGMAATGAHYGTCIVPSLSMRRYELIALWRSDRPRLEPELAELLHMLFPHIQNALKIRQALGVFEERARDAEAILDRSPTASLLLGASGQLLYMNQAARKLVSAQDGFHERSGRILPTQAERTTEFKNLLRDSGGSWKHPGGAMTLGRTNGKRPLQLLVSPFHHDGRRQSHRVLVLATDPDQPPSFSDAVLRQLYGLTTAETEVANGLLTGFSPEAIAVIRGVTVGTVRSQVKSLLLKTDTQRQMDLVRLLSSVPKTPQARTA